MTGHVQDLWMKPGPNECAVCHAAIFKVERRGCRPFWRHEYRAQQIVGPHTAEPVQDRP